MENIYHFICDFWKIVKKYYAPEEDEFYYKKLETELLQLVQQYGTDKATKKFLKSVVVDFMIYQAERGKDYGEGF